MIQFPNIDPVLLRIGYLEIRWYSLAYIFGILLGYKYLQFLVKKFTLKISSSDLNDYLTWCIIAIIAGGRLGYVIFYNPLQFLFHPWEILQTYQGGMSFHGGFAGVIIMTFFFCKKKHIPYLAFCDLLAVVNPIGLFLGRIANFINAELYGRVTTMPWGVIFPQEFVARHPSQLYEAFAEGIVLFSVINYFIYYTKIIKYPGLNSILFLILYALARSFCEQYRQPDEHIGFLFGNTTMGQILSVVMLLIAASIFIKQYRNYKNISINKST